MNMQRGKTHTAVTDVVFYPPQHPRLGADDVVQEFMRCGSVIRGAAPKRHQPWRHSTFWNLKWLTRAGLRSFQRRSQLFQGCYDILGPSAVPRIGGRKQLSDCIMLHVRCTHRRQR